jgi:hypothetical protein
MTRPARAARFGHYACVSPRPTARDYAWVSVAAIASLVLLTGLLNVGWATIVEGRWIVLVTAPVGVVFWYWIIAGCWRRTVWGRA